MSFRSFMMARPPLARRFMSTVPSSMHLKGGTRTALEAYRAATERTAAYPALLAEYGLDVFPSLGMDRWRELPIIDKGSYIDRFPIEALALDGRLTTAYTIEKSSGHGGKDYYWLRTPEEDSMFPIYLEFAFRQFYGMDQRSTLVIITLALGTWTSGEKMAQALRQVAATGKYPLTVMSPGTKVEEILDIVRDLSPCYDQTVLVGYPPFLKQVLDTGEAAGMDWRDYHVRLGTGGEGHSEEWRTFTARRLGIDPDTDLQAISGGYGAADLGMSVGREYPLTVMIRRLAAEDHTLAEALFGEGLPNLFQYSPQTAYAEEADGELVFTVVSGIPLVRYNIHDRGGLIPFERMMEILGEAGVDPVRLLEERGYSAHDVWKLPFMYVYGRSDGSVAVAGANVYAQNIESALSMVGDSAIAGHKMETHQDSTFTQRLVIHLEHRNAELDSDTSSELAMRYREVIVEGLKQVNREFGNVAETTPDLAAPIVRVYSAGSGPFAKDKGAIKRRYRL